MGAFAVQNDWTLRPILSRLDEFFEQLLALFTDSRGQPSLEKHKVKSVPPHTYDLNLVWSSYVYTST